MDDLGTALALWPPDPPDGVFRWAVEMRFALVSGRAECVGVDVSSYLTDDQRSRYRELRGKRLEGLSPIGAENPMRDIPFGRLIDLGRRTLLLDVVTHASEQKVAVSRTRVMRAGKGFVDAYAAHLDDMPPAVRGRALPAADAVTTISAPAPDAVRLIEAIGDLGMVPGKPRRRGGRRRKYDDSFYGRVAETYMAAWRVGANPTKAVASAEELRPHTPVSVSTAANWVSTCRGMGLLPTTTRGRATGVLPRARKPEPKATRKGRKR